ncbi:unnamed protein product, partial [Prorocentrum cordatum]
RNAGTVGPCSILTFPPPRGRRRDVWGAGEGIEVGVHQHNFALERIAQPDTPYGLEPAAAWLGRMLEPAAAAGTTLMRAAAEAADAEEAVREAAAGVPPIATAYKWVVRAVLGGPVSEGGVYAEGCMELLNRAIGAGRGSPRLSTGSCASACRKGMRTWRPSSSGSGWRKA